MMLLMVTTTWGLLLLLLLLLLLVITTTTSHHLQTLSTRLASAVNLVIAGAKVSKVAKTIKTSEIVAEKVCEVFHVNLPDSLARCSLSKSHFESDLTQM